MKAEHVTETTEFALRGRHTQYITVLRPQCIAQAWLRWAGKRSLPAIDSSHLPRAVAIIDLSENAMLDAGSGSFDRSTGQREQAGATCRLPWLMRVHHAASSALAV